MKGPVFTKTRSPEMTVLEMDSGFNMQRQHYHDSFEIYLMLDGKRHLSFYEKHYDMEKGNLLIVRPFCLHATTSPEHEHFKRYLLNFSPDELTDLSDFFNTKQLLNSLRSCLITLNEERLGIVYNQFKITHRNIRRYIKNKSNSNNMLMKMSLLQLADYLSELIKEPSAIKFEEDEIDITSPITRALAYINAHSHESISLDFISDYVHMSKSNFCLVFKKAVGDTFVNYINSVRIAHSHKLISSTDLSLTEIAGQTGFASVDYLTRTFKKIHGISPSKLRNSQK